MENRSWGRDPGSRDVDSPGLRDSLLVEAEGQLRGEVALGFGH